MKSRRQRILVVDDERDIVDTLTEHFETTYDVAAALDGAHAIKLVRKKRPDLILLDLRMPGLGGLDVLKAVKQIDPKVPVVVITGNADVDVAAEAIAQGAFSYVPKPFDFAYLDHLVAVALGG
jgi:DNA-binding NtrC family response regulator